MDDSALERRSHGLVLGPVLPSTYGTMTDMSELFCGGPWMAHTIDAPIILQRGRWRVGWPKGQIHGVRDVLRRLVLRPDLSGWCVDDNVNMGVQGWPRLVRGYIPCAARLCGVLWGG